MIGEPYNLIQELFRRVEVMRESINTLQDMHFTYDNKALTEDEKHEYQDINLWKQIAELKEDLLTNTKNDVLASHEILKLEDQIAELKEKLSGEKKVSGIMDIDHTEGVEKNTHANAPKADELTYSKPKEPKSLIVKYYYYPSGRKAGEDQYDPKDYVIAKREDLEKAQKHIQLLNSYVDKHTNDYEGNKFYQELEGLIKQLLKGGVWD